MKKRLFKMKCHLFIILVFGIVSCSKMSDQIVTKNQEPSMQSDAVELLQSFGFKVEDINYVDNGFLVEGDLFFSENWISENMDDNNARHRKFYSCLPFSNSLISNVELYIKANNFNHNQWLGAYNDAVDEWNDLTGTSINITSHVYKYGGYDPNDPTHVLVETAEVSPADGIVTGWSGCNALPAYLRIDDDLVENTPPSWGPGHKKTLFMHEIGHVLGFHHTNGGGHFISGTCSSDANSIMNNPAWGNFDFTSCDVQAAQILYP